MKIEEWAVEGIRLAEKNGKSLDDLIKFIKVAWMFKEMFQIKEEET